MRLPAWCKKTIHPLIAYPLLVIFSLVLFAESMFFVIKHEVVAQTQGYIAPFDGYITYVEYNCLCSLGIKLTITPITQTSRTNWGTSYDLMYYYGPQLLEEVVELFGLDMPDEGLLGEPIIIPRLYAFYNIWYAGEQKLLGNAVRGSFPCVAYIPPSECSVDGYGQGAVMMVGTSMY